MRNQRVNENRCALLAAAITAGIVWLAGLSGCGVSAGPVTIGTTGFLQEVNKGRGLGATKKEISDSDRAEMNAFLEGEYGR